MPDKFRQKKSKKKGKICSILNRKNCVITHKKYVCLVRAHRAESMNLKAQKKILSFFSPIMCAHQQHHYVAICLCYRLMYVKKQVLFFVFFPSRLLHRRMLLEFNQNKIVDFSMNEWINGREVETNSTQIWDEMRMLDA